MSFNESAFKARVSKALEKVRTLLEVTRHPTFPADAQARPSNFITFSSFFAQYLQTL